MKVLRPHLKVIFMSGYMGDALIGTLALPSDVILLNKPFSRSSLLAEVDKVSHNPTPTIRGLTSSYNHR